MADSNRIQIIRNLRLQSISFVNLPLHPSWSIIEYGPVGSEDEDFDIEAWKKANVEYINEPKTS